MFILIMLTYYFYRVKLKLENKIIGDLALFTALGRRCCLFEGNPLLIMRNEVTM